jgi:hypothetical protein
LFSSFCWSLLLFLSHPFTAPSNFLLAEQVSRAFVSPSSGLPATVRGRRSSVSKCVAAAVGRISE